MNVYISPSFYAHIVNGILLLAAIIVFIKNYKKLVSLESYKFIKLVLFLSIAAGVHGLSHLGLESVYNYNPLTIFDFNK
jgi:hypothetical protein